MIREIFWISELELCFSDSCFIKTVKNKFTLNVIYFNAIIFMLCVKKRILQNYRI